jgi:membrane associated rhomboid family serine protease
MIGYRFQIPPVIKNLLIINGLLYLCVTIFHKISYNSFGLLVSKETPIYDYLALHNITNDNFGIWQFITHMFVHDQDPMHIFFNMFALWMFGRHIESRWGSKRFLQYYLFAGIGAAVLHMIITGGGSSVMFGASGAVFGILLAFGMVYPNTQILLLIPPMPIKAKYLVIGYGLLELFLGYGSPDDGVAHFAHVGGMLFGLLVFLYWKIKGIYY